MIANMFYAMLWKVIYVTKYNVLSELYVFLSTIMRGISPFSWAFPSIGAILPLNRYNANVIFRGRLLECENRCLRMSKSIIS